MSPYKLRGSKKDIIVIRIFLFFILIKFILIEYLLLKRITHYKYLK